MKKNLLGTLRKIDFDYFFSVALQSIKTMETENGILASSKSGSYGSIFARDSLITALRLLRAYDLQPNQYYLHLVKKILSGLIPLLGKDVNIQSGEEPGKCVHNCVTDPAIYKKLTESTKEKPWYLYPDLIFRNYDSIDSTPLLLICFYRYIQKSKDLQFAKDNLWAIESALDWILNYGDKNNDGFIDFQMHPDRKYGGLLVQNWMDGKDSLFHDDGSQVAFPVATCEVQGYTYLALLLWSRHYQKLDKKKSQTLLSRAIHLKKRFNECFVIREKEKTTFAFAIDNNGKPMTAKRSSLGHLLWAAMNTADDGRRECILKKCYIDEVVKQLMTPDIFEPEAGIRTLSKEAEQFNHLSYQNGTIWLHDNSMIAEGLDNFGFKIYAEQIRLACFHVYNTFHKPVELVVYENGELRLWKIDPETATGATESNDVQAWVAAALLYDSLKLAQET